MLRRGAHSFGRQGFTLIELAIVLVIIGLIVGGVLIGRDLIKAAEVRATITQLEKYNSAAATFQGKFSALPGDIAANAAAQFGLTSRSGSAGRGDGNGELDGFSGATGFAWVQNGENLLFWEDLSSARLIDQNFSTYVDGTSPSCTSTDCNQYFPTAIIGGGNFISVYSGYAANCCVNRTGIGPNFFGLSATPILSSTSITGGLTVRQAYAIDNKIDDGMPTTGRVLAQYLKVAGNFPVWSTNSTADSASTCYNSTTNAYSLTINNGANINCGISFQFQAGD